MLCYKAAQVIVATKNEAKEWEMNGRKGVSHSAVIAVLGQNMRVANLRLRAASEEELHVKISRLDLGKPFEFPVLNVEPVFKMGDDGKRKSDYEYVVDIPPASVVSKKQ